MPRQEVQLGFEPSGAPCEVTTLTDEVFYNQGQARPNPLFCSVWHGLGVLLGVQAVDLMFPLPPLLQGCEHRARQDWLGGQFVLAKFS